MENVELNMPAFFKNISSIAAVRYYTEKKARKSDSLDCNFYAGAAAAVTSSFGLASSEACSWRIAWGKPGKSMLVAQWNMDGK